MPLALFFALLFLHALVSRRLEGTVVTGPIVFTVGGLATALVVPEWSGPAGGRGVFLAVAEVGLVLLLFTDASRADLGVLRGIRALPTRLLAAGLPLSILLGALAAHLVFPRLSIWEAGILAAILAPTDAGLGQVIVSSRSVPVRIREALSVEAGLNDGLAVPFLLFFIALAASDTDATFRRFALEQLGFGVAIGGGIGLAGGAALGLARRQGWMATSSLGLAVLALPVFCLLASGPAGASAFIASFVAGLAAQAGLRRLGGNAVELTESGGQLLNSAVFFLFGLVLARGGEMLAAGPLLYALLSLTVVRMLPVAIALLGSRLDGPTVLFLGWFGPRGLASIVLGLVFLEHESRLAGEPLIRGAVMATVAASVLLHGLSAGPGIAWYARRSEGRAAAGRPASGPAAE